MADSEIRKARLLDSYHRKTALSALPNGYDAYFKLGKIKWGYGLIDKSGETEVLKDIPSDLSQLESVFAEGVATYQYINGKTVITAIMPKDQIPDGQSRPFSMIGIDDGDSELVGAVVVNSQNVTNKMDVAITLAIDHTGAQATLEVLD